MDEQLFAIIGRRIKELREERGYKNQREFAELIGLDGPRLSRIESGQRGIDTLVLHRVSDLLEVPMDEFFRPRAEGLALARSGQTDTDEARVMIEFARELQENLEVVERYVVPA